MEMKALPLTTSQLSLPLVLKCGQSFRWQSVSVSDENISQEWRFTLPDRVVCLRQSPTHLFYQAIFPDKTQQDDDLSTLSWLRDYFHLDLDLELIYSEIKDPVFQRALQRLAGGIRILRQDPWENLISFICSQNNHITRITSMVQSLCIRFSSPLLSLPSASSPYSPFPEPQALADPSVELTLRELGFGYRAKYIQQTAALLCQTHSDPRAWLLSLRQLTTGEARQELLKLPGVGPKVADCILLMSLDKHDVVPIDTHMLQIASTQYRIGNLKGRAANIRINAEIASHFQHLWGTYAGWAHSVLFTSDLKLLSVAPGPEKGDEALESNRNSPKSSRGKGPLAPIVHQGPQVNQPAERSPADSSYVSSAERVKRRTRRTNPKLPETQ